MIIATDNKHYYNIADAIREVTGKATTYKPEEMADGVAEVYEAGKQAVYETIVIAQDCTNALQVYEMFGAINSPTDKMVLFVNKAWTGVPSADTPNNKALYMLWLNDEFWNGTRNSFWCRWRDNSYNTNVFAGKDYDFIVSAGEEWLKVVLL